MIAKFHIFLVLVAGLLLVQGCATVNTRTRSSGEASVAQPAVPQSAAEVSPALVGSMVPNMFLSILEPKSSGPSTVNLADAAKRDPLVLIFYRGGWCPYCNLQLQDIRKIEGDLTKLGYRIIGISPDRMEELAKSVEKNKLKYSLVSDAKAELMRAMGIAFKVDDKTQDQLKGYGINLSAAAGEDHGLLPVPSVFLVDRDGKISFSYVNPDYKVRLPASVVLAAAKASFKPIELKK